jgi:hypothetical protein
MMYPDRVGANTLPAVLVNGLPTKPGPACSDPATCSHAHRKGQKRQRVAISNMLKVASAAPPEYDVQQQQQQSQEQQQHQQQQPHHEPKNSDSGLFTVISRGGKNHHHHHHQEQQQQHQQLDETPTLGQSPEDFLFHIDESDPILQDHSQSFPPDGSSAGTVGCDHNNHSDINMTHEDDDDPSSSSNENQKNHSVAKTSHTSTSKILSPMPLNQPLDRTDRKEKKKHPTKQNEPTNDDTLESSSSSRSTIHQDNSEESRSNAGSNGTDDETVDLHSYSQHFRSTQYELHDKQQSQKQQTLSEKAYDDDDDDAELEEGEDGRHKAGVWDDADDQEDEILTQELLQGIRDAENFEFFMKHGSMVRHICPASDGSMIGNSSNVSNKDKSDHNDDNDGAICMGECEPWTVQPQSRLHRNSADMMTTATTSTDSKVSNVDEVRHVDVKLPKRIPAKSDGTYSCKDDRVLFTPAQFQTFVVDKVESQLSHEDAAGINFPDERTPRSSILDWTVRITDRHPRNPNGYLLEARGTPDALKLLHEQTQSFIRSVLKLHNKKSLLEDDKSIFVDISVGHNKKHGIQCEDDPDGVTPLTNGVWIKRLAPGKHVAAALGSEQIKNRAMMVTAVNGTVVNSEKEFKVAVRKAMEQNTKKNMIVTLCLSESTDLVRAPNLSSLNMRYHDGSPFDIKDYKFDLALSRQRRFAELHSDVFSPSDEEPCWIEYPQDESYVPAKLPQNPLDNITDITRAYKKVMKAQRSVVVDLTLPWSNADFGAKINVITADEKSGVYLTNISPDGPLGMVLREEATKNGCVLLKASSKPVHTEHDVEVAAETAANGSLRVTIGTNFLRRSAIRLVFVLRNH